MVYCYLGRAAGVWRAHLTGPVPRPCRVWCLHAVPTCCAYVLCARACLAGAHPAPPRPLQLKGIHKKYETFGHQDNSTTMQVWRNVLSGVSKTAECHEMISTTLVTDINQVIHHVHALVCSVGGLPTTPPPPPPPPPAFASQRSRPSVRGPAFAAQRSRRHGRARAHLGRPAPAPAAHAHARRHGAPTDRPPPRVRV